MKAHTSFSTIEKTNFDAGNDLYLDPYIQQITNKEKVTIPTTKKSLSKLSDSQKYIINLNQILRRGSDRK